MVMKRARDEKQKSERKQVILDSAWHLYQVMDGVFPSVAKIAENAGLAKGTVYLYFKTKEEIYLCIVEQQMEQLFTNLFKEIAGKSTISIEKLIDAIVATFHDNAVLRLFSMASTVLENNVDNDFLYPFKLRIAKQLTDYGSNLERLFPHLQKGAGGRLIVRTYIIMLGVHQIVPASKRIEQLLQKPGMDLLNVDFKQELRNIIEILWEGSLRTL